PVDRPDARRRAGRDARDRAVRGGQRGAPRRVDPRQQAPRDPGRAQELPRGADRARAREPRSPPAGRPGPKNHMTVIGVLGAGQLGRMLALAGYPLGLRFVFYDPSAEAPAGHLADLRSAPWDDHDALQAFAADVDLVTYEFENVPVSVATRLAERV